MKMTVTVAVTANASNYEVFYLTCSNSKRLYEATLDTKGKPVKLSLKIRPESELVMLLKRYINSGYRENNLVAPKIF